MAAKQAFWIEHCPCWHFSSRLNRLDPVRRCCITQSQPQELCAPLRGAISPPPLRQEPMTFAIFCDFRLARLRDYLFLCAEKRRAPYAATPVKGPVLVHDRTLVIPRRPRKSRARSEAAEFGQVVLTLSRPGGGAGRIGGASRSRRDPRNFAQYAGRASRGCSC